MITALTTTFFAGITIVLPMEAPVRGSEIELGEVATITGATAEELALLEGLELGRTPSAGYDRKLQEADIRVQLERVLPGREIAFAGRRICRAYIETHLVTPIDINAAVSAKLSDAVGGRDVTWAPPKLGSLDIPLSQDGSEPTLSA